MARRLPPQFKDAGAPTLVFSFTMLPGRNATKAAASSVPSAKTARASTVTESSARGASVPAGPNRAGQAGGQILVCGTLGVRACERVANWGRSRIRLGHGVLRGLACAGRPTRPPVPR